MRITLSQNGNGTVYIGKYTGSTVAGLIAAGPVDANGFWKATSLPVQSWDLVAITADHSTIGRSHRHPAPVANQVTYANITHPGRHSCSTAGFNSPMAARRQGRLSPVASLSESQRIPTAISPLCWGYQSVRLPISAGLAPSRQPRR